MSTNNPTEPVLNGQMDTTNDTTPIKPPAVKEPPRVRDKRGRFQARGKTRSIHAELEAAASAHVLTLTPGVEIPPPQTSLPKETQLFGCNRCGKTLALSAVAIGHTCNPEHVRLLEALFGPYEATLNNNSNSGSSNSNALAQLGTLVEDKDDTFVVYSQQQKGDSKETKSEKKEKKQKSNLRKRKAPVTTDEKEVKEPAKKRVRFSSFQEEKKIPSNSTENKEEEGKDKKKKKEQQPEPDQVDFNLAWLEILVYLPWVAEEQAFPDWADFEEMKPLFPADKNLLYSMSITELAAGDFGMWIVNRNRINRHRERVCRSYYLVTRDDLPRLVMRCIKENIRLVREKTDKKALLGIAKAAKDFHTSMAVTGNRSFWRLQSLHNDIVQEMVVAGVMFAYNFNSMGTSNIKGRGPMGKKMLAIEDRFLTTLQLNAAVDNDDGI